jgi:C-terminal processing protease CtpA/Prc
MMKKSSIGYSAQAISVSLSFVLFITSCGPVTPVLTPTPTQAPTSTVAPSPMPVLEAQEYLSEALDIIQTNALYSDQVDWPKVRSIASLYEKNAKTPADTYDSISFALQQLGDNHSRFLRPEAVDELNNLTVEDNPPPEGKLLADKIGYVAVPEFGAVAEDEVNKHADKIQNLIIELEKQSVCGWVVDLRANLGGNMYPMIAGLGALIGEGDLGSFKDATGHMTNWYYRDGQAGMGNEPIAKVSRPEFLFNPNDTPVAVLIGPQTASSGEATAISFIGRPNTQFFGQPSYGLTTGNDLFMLSDGAAILLTVVVELDRTGKEYGGSIMPDIPTSNPELEATDWLLTQLACKE